MKSRLRNLKARLRSERRYSWWEMRWVKRAGRGILSATAANSKEALPCNEGRSKWTGCRLCCGNADFP